MKTKTAIDEIIYELNDVFGIDNPEGFSFVYETKQTHPSCIDNDWCNNTSLF